MAKASIAEIPVLRLAQAVVSLCREVKTQSGQHIKALHSHCSNRLVIEGGFPPEWVSPRPPLASRHEAGDRHLLLYAPEAENRSEQIVLGGMKYKNLDVAVHPPGIGPALGISVKSTGNAFRNLTNRMEEAPGDCVNIHMMYPGFVFGFLHLIRFAQEGDVQSPNDVSFDAQGAPLDSIVRYHNALCALNGRLVITDPPMRYESIGLLVYRCAGERAELWDGYPSKDSPIHYSRFFDRLYSAYDLRYAYPDARGNTHRKSWTLAPEQVAASYDTETKFAWGPRLSR